MSILIFLQEMQKEEKEVAESLVASIVSLKSHVTNNYGSDTIIGGKC